MIHKKDCQIRNPFTSLVASPAVTSSSLLLLIRQPQSAAAAADAVDAVSIRILYQQVTDSQTTVPQNITVCFLTTSHSIFKNGVQVTDRIYEK